MEKMWFLFKILHVRGRNTCLCKEEMCFILLEGVLTSFLYIDLVTMFTYILLIFDTYIHIYIYIYDDDDVCLIHLSLHVLFLFYLYTHVSFLYAIFYFYFTLRCRDEFCLKYFRNTSCQSLLAMDSYCKVFQEFVLG